MWQRKQQLRELREQDKRRQEERKLEQERLEREPAPKPYEEDGFMVHGGQDAFANKNAFQMPALDLAACRKLCQDRGFGGFTVWNGQAYFRGEKMDNFKSNMKRAAGTTLYINLETDAQRRARLTELGIDPDAKPQEKRKGKPKSKEEEELDEEPARRPRGPPVQERAKQEQPRERKAEGKWEETPHKPQERKAEGKWEQKPHKPQERKKPRPKLRAPGSYVLPVFAQHDRSNHAERQALIKVIARVQEASGAQNDAEFEREAAEVTGTVRLYASHTPCISCMACFCQFQRLFPKVKLCVDFDDWRDTRRMVEMARREEEYKQKKISPPSYDCAGLSDMSDEEDFLDDDEPGSSGAAAAAAAAAASPAGRAQAATVAA